MGNYTIWNGNKNRNQVKLNKLAKEAAQLDSTAQALNLQEQIAQLTYRYFTLQRLST